jgi:hypothetical protein
VNSPALAALAAALVLVPLAVAKPAAAGDVQGDAYDCQELWVMRNCFATERAVTYFGIGGCTYDTEEDVPLSKMEKRTIDEIRASEARQSCS